MLVEKRKTLAATSQNGLAFKKNQGSLLNDSNDRDCFQRRHSI